MILRRRLLVPEVVQTSAMDCGPAALKALLNGYGINASYGRLREACQTDVDGTSIDTLEETAKQLGLDAEQVMTLPDHLFESDENLPCQPFCFLGRFVIIEIVRGRACFWCDDVRVRHVGNNHIGPLGTSASQPDRKRHRRRRVPPHV